MYPHGWLGIKNQLSIEIYVCIHMVDWALKTSYLSMYPHGWLGIKNQLSMYPHGWLGIKNQLSIYVSTWLTGH